jgi:hypothetical protein
MAQHINRMRFGSLAIAAIANASLLGCGVAENFRGGAFGKKAVGEDPSGPQAVSSPTPEPTGPAIAQTAPQGDPSIKTKWDIDAKSTSVIITDSGLGGYTGSTTVGGYAISTVGRNEGSGYFEVTVGTFDGKIPTAISKTTMTNLALDRFSSTLVSYIGAVLIDNRSSADRREFLDDNAYKSCAWGDLGSVGNAGRFTRTTEQFSAADVIGVAISLKQTGANSGTHTVRWTKNGSEMPFVCTISGTGSLYPAIWMARNIKFTANFGALPFRYKPLPNHEGGWIP